MTSIHFLAGSKAFFFFQKKNDEIIDFNLRNPFKLFT